jgi:hypothetical protein
MGPNRCPLSPSTGRNAFLAALMAFCAFALGACTTTTNSAMAEAPFPSIPSQPDGVCPDFSGKYIAEATSEEIDSYDKEKRARELGFQKTLNEPAPRKLVRHADGKLRAVPLLFVEVVRIDNELIEVTKWYSRQEEASHYRSRLISGDQFCHQARLIKIDRTKGGSEIGTKTTDTIEITTKEDDGSILKREFEQARTSAMIVIPGGFSRSVYTYRFAPYILPTK